MFKCISLLKKKPGLSRDDLIHYYETQHAPLIRRLLPEIRDYRRNFIDLTDAVIFGGVIDFDVVTEIWFDDRAGYDAFVARCAEPDVGRQIAEDEEHVFDRTATRMFTVDERGAAGAVVGDQGMAAALRALQDEREILRKLSRFTRVLDAKDIPALSDVFAADMTFDYGRYGEHEGIAALQEWMHGSLDNCGGTQHLLGNVLVDVDGDRAVSRAYVLARHQHIDDLGGPIFDTNGEYVDKWERRPEGWRIVRRDARWMVINGDPSIVGVEELALD